MTKIEIWIVFGFGTIVGWLLRGLAANCKIYFLNRDLNRALSEIARLEQYIDEHCPSVNDSGVSLEEDAPAGWYGNDLGGEG